ncbi:MAG: 8-amino-7-oxononanoate synthase [Verrucomicrobiae bacterium]|nr:8-amino-7-oxononanoate synthase [Verrucomicrobiae bacterium]
MDKVLQSRLEELSAQQLRRKLTEVGSPQGPEIEIEGRKYSNFSSNDYLGLAAHPRVREGARRAIEEFGAGSGASRLICGDLAPARRLERKLAEHLEAQAALVFSSGYAAALGVIPALVGPEDTLILDKLCHASIIDAAKQSGAALRVYPHGNVEPLAEHLDWASARSGQTLVVTESIFSMDGDRAPLRAIVELKERRPFWLMVDEAHAIGVLGQAGRGLANELGLAARIEIRLGTLGKALGSAGGFALGSGTLIEWLINRARSFIYSTGPTPSACGAAEAAIDVLRETPEPQRRLWENIRALEEAADLKCESAIVPVVVGDEAATLEAAASLREAGYWVPAIRYPTVARGKARLRVSLSAAHSAQAVAALAGELKRIRELVAP